MQLHNLEIKNGSYRISTPLLPPLSEGPNTFGSKSTPSTPQAKPLAHPPLPPTKEWPRPSTMPYQAKAANSLSLIGYVDNPIRSRLLLMGSSGPPLLSPKRVLLAVNHFGDLARVTAFHLKENDLVCMDGQVTSDPPPLDATHGIANVQHGKWWGTMHQFPGDNFLIIQKNGLIAVNINTMERPSYPDFKCKDDGLAPWLDSALQWVLSGLEGVEFDVPLKKQKVQNAEGDEPWKSLVENPDKWWDNRLDKKNHKAPGFKHKETLKALWLTDSPAWVQSKLPFLKSRKGTATGKMQTLLSVEGLDLI